MQNHAKSELNPPPSQQPLWRGEGGLGGGTVHESDGATEIVCKSNTYQGKTTLLTTGSLCSHGADIIVRSMVSLCVDIGFGSCLPPKKTAGSLQIAQRRPGPSQLYHFRGPCGSVSEALQQSSGGRALYVFFNTVVT